MEKTLFPLFILLAVGITSCGNQQENVILTNSKTDTGSCAGNIAYVEVDSLMSQYQFAKDFTIILTKKGENIQNTLSKKERELQQRASAMQKKYESGGFSSSQELQAAQQDLQLQQQNLQALSERLTTDFATEQERFNTALRDSLRTFLRIYNKEKKYDFILSRAGDNMLYANPHLDITAQVVNGLNKRYKPTKEITDRLSDK